MGSSHEQVAPHDVKFSPYTPITSLARELGILFGFLAACIAIMVLYYFIWQAVLRRNTTAEAARVEALVARTRAAEAEKQRANANANANGDGKGNGNGNALGGHVRNLSKAADLDTDDRIAVGGMGVRGLEVGGEEDLVV